MIIPTDFTVRENVPSISQIDSHSTTISIGMIGDILLHHPLFTYENYDFAFANVKDKLTSIDFLLANQESMPGGVELGLSGYPSFNSPKHIIRDLKANGVDMLSIANNHTIDRKETGVMNAIGYMGEYDMPYVGAYTSFLDQAEDRIVEVDGVRLGILAYTYGTNGIPVPEGKEYLVSLIDRERIQEEITDLKKRVDVLIVSLHWGNEYQLEPSKEQVDLAQFVAEQRADVLFGHHPHVLQKHDRIEDTEIFYSIGNFYSAQQFDSTNIGGIARVTAAKTVFGGKSITVVGNPVFFPTAVTKDAQNRYHIIPLKDAGSNAIYDEKWAMNHLNLPSW
ncbi:CapA family protein [Sporosarcina sp. FA9]|uniref:CapA family protein n=1 Tax=Sporosarcina sp. FA9 TaxID=3413030 RepID=UPI003F65BECC